MEIIILPLSGTCISQDRQQPRVAIIDEHVLFLSSAYNSAKNKRNRQNFNEIGDKCDNNWTINGDQNGNDKLFDDKMITTTS
uniref:Uncharacterized protein n=1 Tax=Romanomermis culicivorax TaxID=13658 RepID=A0A915K5G1_ROMCU